MRLQFAPIFSTIFPTTLSKVEAHTWATPTGQPPAQSVFRVAPPARRTNGVARLAVRIYCATRKLFKVHKIECARFGGQWREIKMGSNLRLAGRARVFEFALPAGTRSTRAHNTRWPPSGERQRKWGYLCPAGHGYLTRSKRKQFSAAIHRLEWR